MTKFSGPSHERLPGFFTAKLHVTSSAVQKSCSSPKTLITLHCAKCGRVLMSPGIMSWSKFDGVRLMISRRTSMCLLGVDVLTFAHAKSTVD